MSGEPKTHTLTLEEALQKVERNERGDEPRMLPTGHGRWSVTFFNRNYTIHDTWPEAASHALGVRVVARDDAAELRAALRRCSNLIQDFLDFGIAPVDRGPARHAVEAAEAVLRRLAGGESER